MSVRTYRWHRCSRRHLSGRSFAACAFSRDYSLDGSGQWAVVATCEHRTISLFTSKAAAAAHIEHLDADSRGVNCFAGHQIGYIDLAHLTRDLAAARANGAA